MMTGTIATVFAVGYFAVTLYLCRNFKFNTKAICIGALGVGMTILLASIMIPLPTGAAVSCGSWIPLMLIAIVYDYRLSMISGFACGVLALFLLPGWAPVHWAQIILEHMIAFSCLGYAGLFGNKKRSRILWGIALAILLRSIAQVLSGVIFFSQNAWVGWGAWGYSIGYHISCKVPETIVTVAVLMALPLQHLAKTLKGGNK